MDFHRVPMTLGLALTCSLLAAAPGWAGDEESAQPRHAESGVDDVTEPDHDVNVDDAIDQGQETDVDDDMDRDRDTNVDHDDDDSRETNVDEDTE